MNATLPIPAGARECAAAIQSLSARLGSCVATGWTTHDGLERAFALAASIRSMASDLDHELHAIHRAAMDNIDASGRAA